MSNVLPFPKTFGASDGERVLVSRWLRETLEGPAIAFVVYTVDRRGMAMVPVWEGANYREALKAAAEASTECHIPIEIDIRAVRS